MKTGIGPVFAASVIVSLYGPPSADSVGFVLLVTSIPFGSYTLSASTSIGFPELQGRLLIVPIN